MKNMWLSLSKGNRRILVVIGSLFAVISVAGLILGAIKLFTADSDGSAVEEKPDKGDSVAEAEEISNEEEEADGPEPALSDWLIETDGNGMGVMPVTTDPAEAAVGAAQVAFTVDLSKQTRQEFFDEAIQRMTHPTPEYKGAEGEVHTMVIARPFEETERHYWAPEQALHELVTGAGLQDDPLAFWWLLANSSMYDNLAWMPDPQITAKPLEVLSEEEMAELYPRAIPRMGADTDLEPDTEGATLTNWWVLLEVDGIQGEGAAPRYQYPAQFAIYCDAPEDGGVCGVAYTLNTEMPPAWLRQ